MVVGQGAPTTKLIKSLDGEGFWGAFNRRSSVKTVLISVFIESGVPKVLLNPDFWGKSFRARACTTALYTVTVREPHAASTVYTVNRSKGPDQP